MPEVKYTLSIKQPWAWLIAKGYKDIENRDWFIGRKVASGAVSFTIQLPARIYIHAGKQIDMDGLNYLLTTDLPGVDKIPMYETLSLGAIIGEVDITHCVIESKSPWFKGKCGFVLANPVLYDKPIPCRGALGFFIPNIPVEVTK